MRCLVVLATVSCALPDRMQPEDDRVSSSSMLVEPEVERASERWRVGSDVPWETPMLSGPDDPWHVATTYAPRYPAPPDPPAPPPELPARLPPPAVRIASNLQPPRDSQVASVHSTQISIVAVSEDGTAAVSADQRGSLRLWPALDGTREPVIVSGRAAAQLALIRLATGFSIAVIDHAGQLEVLGTTQSGHTRSRKTVEIPRPLVEIHALATGFFIALRDDRAVVAIDRDGSVVGALAAEPGVRIAQLAVRNNAVLALLDTGDEVHGRWINVIPTPAWGNVTPKLVIEPVNRVVLSPDHRQLASMTEKGRVITIVNVTNGQRIARPVNQEFPDAALTPLGFLDNETLAISSGSRAFLWRKRGLDSGELETTTVVPAVANGKLVGAAAMHLTLLRPGHDTQQLGYRVTNITALQRRVNGWLLTDGAQVVRVDDQLRERGAYEHPEVTGINYMYGTTLLDGDRVLTMGHNGRSTAAYLIDHARGTAERVVEGALIGYEPSTRVAAFRLQHSYEIARFDPKTGQFGPLTTLPIDAKTNAQVLLPRRGQGALATIVTFEPDGLHAINTAVKAIPDATGGSLRLGRPRKITLPDSFLDGMTGLESLLPVPKPQYTSPDKSRVAELDGARIRLRDSAGTELWTIASSGASGLAWTPNNELIAFGSGIARLDVATGARVARQCGWRFGLWTEQVSSFGGGDLCEAP